MHAAAILTLVLAFGFSPRVPATPSGAAPLARLLDIGWTLQDGAVKVVAHLDGPVRFRATTQGNLLLADLWPVAGPLDKVVEVRTGRVGSARTERVAEGVVRLTITLDGPVRYKLFTRAQPDKLSIVLLPPWRAETSLPASVAYRKLRVATGRGTTRVHVVTVDARDPRIELRPVLATGVVPGHEPTAAAATRHDAVAAINGGFFTVPTGQPLGLVVIDGKLLSTPFPRRSVFAITTDGEPVIRPFSFQGAVHTDDGQRVQVSAVNRPPRAGGVAVYTQEYGPLTPPQALHAVVRDGYVTNFTSGRVPIPADGYVLSAAASERALILNTFRRNQRVRLDLGISPGSLVHAIGGGPRLVSEGRVSIPYHWERFSRAFALRRTSRSAVGITAPGKVLLVTVEGLTRGNTGMNLFELARLLRDLGAVEAMNMDGGGSSTLVVGGRVVNRPETEQRGVASMLVVLRRPGN